LEHDVLGLDVAVDDLFAVGGLESVEDLIDQMSDDAEIKSLVVDHEAINLALKGTRAGYILHRHVGAVVEDAVLQQPHDVGALQHREGRGLVLELLKDLTANALVGGCELDELDGGLESEERALKGKQDLAEAALTELADDEVVADVVPDERLALARGLSEGLASVNSGDEADRGQRADPLGAGLADRAGVAAAGAAPSGLARILARAIVGIHHEGPPRISNLVVQHNLIFRSGHDCCKPPRICDGPSAGAPLCRAKGLT